MRRCTAPRCTTQGGATAISRRWNIACDYAINPLLVEAGFELPEGALLDPAYAGLSAEDIYARLPRTTATTATIRTVTIGTATIPAAWAGSAIRHLAAAITGHTPGSRTSPASPAPARPRRPI